MLTATAAPSSTARAEENVVMSLSPLTGFLKSPAIPGCGDAARPDAMAAAARIGNAAALPRLGLAGVRGCRIWTVRRCSIHVRVLLALAGFPRRRCRGHAIADG